MPMRPASFPPPGANPEQRLIAYAQSPQGHASFNFPPCIRQAFQQAESAPSLIATLRHWTRNRHPPFLGAPRPRYYRIDLLMQAVAPVWLSLGDRQPTTPNTFLSPASLIPHCLKDSHRDDAPCQVLTFFHDLLIETEAFLPGHDTGDPKQVFTALSDSYEAYMHPLLVACERKGSQEAM